MPGPWTRRPPRPARAQRQCRRRDARRSRSPQRPVARGHRPAGPGGRRGLPPILRSGRSCSLPRLRRSAPAVRSTICSSPAPRCREMYAGLPRARRTTLPSRGGRERPGDRRRREPPALVRRDPGSPKARFDPRFMDLGIHPGGGHLWRMERLVGRQAAAALVLFGESLTGEEAARVGLAWRCVDDDELLETAIALARRAADRPRELIGSGQVRARRRRSRSTRAGGVRARVRASGLVDGPARVPGPSRRAAGEAREGLNEPHGRASSDARGTRSGTRGCRRATGPACAVRLRNASRSRLSAPPYLGRGHGIERHELHVVDLDPPRAEAVPPAHLDLRPCPQRYVSVIDPSRTPSRRSGLNCIVRRYADGPSAHRPGTVSRTWRSCCRSTTPNSRRRRCAADPETVVPDDAIPFDEWTGTPVTGALPTWYMAAPMAPRALSGWRRLVRG